MKRIKAPITFLLSLCLFLVMNFYLPNVEVAKAAEFHVCSDGGMSPTKVYVPVHGSTITECYHDILVATQ